MNKLMLPAALFLMVPVLTPAQEVDRPPRGQGYIFVGVATHQMGAVAGFGGEYIHHSGLGADLEVGTEGFNTLANGNPNWIGTGSADASYHLFAKKIDGHAVPFVAGGYTGFFGQDTLVPSTAPGCEYNCWGTHTNGFNVGGGVDFFASKHLGVRLDVRYYGHGGRILWASFPNDAQLNFVAFRVGLTFR